MGGDGSDGMGVPNSISVGGSDLIRPLAGVWYKNNQTGHMPGVFPSGNAEPDRELPHLAKGHSCDTSDSFLSQVQSCLWDSLESQHPDKLLPPLRGVLLRPQPIWTSGQVGGFPGRGPHGTMRRSVSLAIPRRRSPLAEQR